MMAIPAENDGYEQREIIKLKRRKEKILWLKQVKDDFENRILFCLN